MEKEQNFLFKKDNTEIPNIYFSSNSTYSNAETSIDMNPNIISNQCKNSNFTTGLTSTGNTSDPNYSDYINNNENFNNFIYKYATGDESMSSFSEPVKNQLKYLGCQIFKNKNREFDTSNFTLSTTDLIQSVGPIIIAVIIFVWLIIQYLMFIFKSDSPFFKNFEFSGFNGGKYCWKYILMFIISCVVISSLGSVLGNIDKGTDSSENIIFYESIENEDLNYDISSYIKSSKWIFLAYLMIIFGIYFLKLTGKIGLSNRWFFGVSSILLIIGLVILFIYNNLDTQYVTADSNLYNTSKNIYQNILNGVKSNFTYIILILLLSVISYVLVLKFKGVNQPILKFLIILLSSFAYFLPLLIFIFEIILAIIYPIPFILIIVIFRALFYLISYIIKSVNIPQVTTLLAMLFEFPKDYFDKMRNGGVPDKFPKNNPTGMPWNLTSISIIKLILFIANITGIETENTYFNRMLK